MTGSIRSRSTFSRSPSQSFFAWPCWIPSRTSARLRKPGTGEPVTNNEGRSRGAVNCTARTLASASAKAETWNKATEEKNTSTNRLAWIIVAVLLGRSERGFSKRGQPTNSGTPCEDRLAHYDADDIQKDQRMVNNDGSAGQ